MGMFRGASVGLLLTAQKDAKYSRAMREAKAEARAWQKTVDDASAKVGKSFRRVAAGAALLGAAGVGLAVREGVNELVDMQKTSAQTASIMEKQGRSAFTTTRHIENLANSVLQMSGIDDQAAQSATNLVLTMGRLDNSTGKAQRNMDRATVAAADLSTRMGGDVTAAAKIVAKALADPEKASGKLGRAIGGLTDAQQKQIDAALKAKDVGKAQALVLDAIEQKVGGAAKAYGETAPAQIAKAREAFAGFSAEIVQRGLPAFLDLMDGANQSIAAIDKWSHTAQGQQALDNLESGAREAVNMIKLLGGEMVNGVQWLTQHEAAVKTVVASYAGFKVFSTVNTTLNTAGAAWQLYSSKMTAAAAKTAGASIASRTASTAVAGLGGPIGIASLAITGLGAAWLYSKKKAAEEEAQTEANARKYRDAAAAAGTLYESQVALRGARLSVAEATAATDRAEKAFAATKPGTQAHADAALALSRAKNNQADATIRAKKTAEDENVKQAEMVAAAEQGAAKLNEIARARAAVATAEKARSGAQSGQQIQYYNAQVTRAKAALDKLTRDEASANEKLRTLRKQGRGDFERIDGQYVVKAGQSAAKEAAARRRWAAQANTWTAAEMGKLAGKVQPGVDATRGQLKRLSVAPYSRAQLINAYAAPFANLGPLISKRVGTIKVEAQAALSLAGGIFGDSPFSMNGPLPAGLAPSMAGPLALGQHMGLSFTSGFRPGAITASGNKSDHSTGHAIDMAGSTSKMAAFYRAAGGLPGLKQRIYSPLDGWSNDHFDHVHVAMFARGGRTNGPEFFGMPQGGLGLRGEDGPEQIVPLSPKYRKDGMRNLYAAADALGVQFHAKGTKKASPLAVATAQARIDANPQAALAQALKQYNATMAAIAAIQKGGVTKKEKDRLKDLQEQAKTLASDVVSKRGAVASDAAQARVDEAASKASARERMATEEADRRARDAQIISDAAQAAEQAAQDAARAAEEAAEAAAQAAKAARDRELAAPKTLMTLVDATRDLERAQAEATATLEDDIGIARQSLADEATRQAAIQAVLDRADLQESAIAAIADPDEQNARKAERADAINQMASSVRAVRTLTTSIEDLTEQQAAEKDARDGTASLDEVAALLKAIRDGLREERSNVGAPIQLTANLYEQQNPGQFLESMRYKITHADVA